MHGAGVGNDLLHGAGEILLAVIGILIVLPTNNWNQGRLDQYD